MFSAQDFGKIKGGGGEATKEDYRVCAWENGCTSHGMAEPPHAVPWGLKEAAKFL